MALGFITTLELSCKIKIALHLFKIVAEYLGSSPLKRKVAQIIQELSSMLIASPFILKEMYLELLI